MKLIPLFAPIAGDLVGYRVAVPVDGRAGRYLAISVLARLDAVFWGWRCVVGGKFQTDALLSGFVASVLIATFLSVLGVYLGINLILAVVLVIGWRIFKNLSRLRKHALSSWRGRRQPKDPVEDGDLDSTVGMT